MKGLKKKEGFTIAVRGRYIHRLASGKPRYCVDIRRDCRET